METLPDIHAPLNYEEDPSIWNSAIDEEMQDKIFNVILDIICDTTERYPLSWELPTLRGIQNSKFKIQNVFVSR